MRPDSAGLRQPKPAAKGNTCTPYPCCGEFFQGFTYFRNIKVVEKLKSRCITTHSVKFKCFNYINTKIYYNFTFLTLMKANSFVVFSKPASLLIRFSVVRITVSAPSNNLNFLLN